VTETQLDEMGPVGFLAKDRDGSVSVLEAGNGLNQLAALFAEFTGASSGRLGDDDLQEAAAALNPGTSAAVLVWENRWAAPVAAALRRSGGQLVASGRLPCRRSSPPSTPSRPATSSRRTSMPGLLRGVARTAVVAGKATAVSNRVSRRQAERWQQQGSYPYNQPKPTYQEPAPQYEQPPPRPSRT